MKFSLSWWGCKKISHKSRKNEVNEFSSSSSHLRIFACLLSSDWYNRQKLVVQLNIWLAYATFKNKRRLIKQPSFSKKKNLSHTFCCYFMGKFLTCLTLSAIALRWKKQSFARIYGLFCAPKLYFCDYHLNSSLPIQSH